MKKILSLILAGLLTLSMVACTSDNKNESDEADEQSKEIVVSEVSLQDIVAEGVVKDFVEYINDSAYADAISYYNSKIVGNYENETDAQEAILTMCENINTCVLMGEYDEKEANLKVDVLERVVDGIDMDDDEFEQLKRDIEESIASKAVYTAGADFEALGNYADAIEQYKKVVNSDSNYTSAVTAIDRCTASLKSEAFGEAQKLASEKKYFEAIEVLKTASKVLPEDSDILGKITVYEQTHKKDAIDSASAAFVTPATDYEAALACINSALQYYPDDADLLAKKEYYNSFIPVNLYDMNYIKGKVYKKESATGTYGDEFTKCFCGYYSWGSYITTDATYDIGKSYNVLTATVYGASDNTEASYGKIQIYADGTLIYENLKVANNQRPFDISLDVTGVAELSIYIELYDWEDDHVGMTDVILQRTVA